MSLSHDEIQQTYVMAELIRTQAELRESLDRMNATLERLQADGLPQSLPKTITVEQAADFCKVKPSTIRNWASTGKIPCHKANGARFFIVGELIEWSRNR